MNDIKVGSTIRWTFNNEYCMFPSLKGKTYTGTVEVINNKEQYYQVHVNGNIGDYLQDYVPFSNATLIN